jgi:hypothetical protein
LAVGREFTQPPSLRIIGAQLDIGGGLNFSWALMVVAPLTALMTFMLLIALERGEQPRPALDDPTVSETSTADAR